MQRVVGSRGTISTELCPEPQGLPGQVLGLGIAPLLAPDRDVRRGHIDDIRMIGPQAPSITLEPTVEIALGIIEIAFAQAKQCNVIEELIISRIARIAWRSTTAKRDRLAHERVRVAVPPTEGVELRQLRHREAQLLTIA